MLQQREMHFTAKGKIVYDPKRGKDKNGKDIIDKDRVVIQINCFDIFDYYAYQFRKKFGIPLIRPSWEPHVTVFANHKYSQRKGIPWGYRNGEIVDVQYSHEMFWNDEHVWLQAECEAVQDIRNAYKNGSRDRGHITIGKFHPNDIGKLPQFKKYEDISLWDMYIFNKPM